MPATYLLRVDDVCPTMNWTIWREMERILLANEVVPILAVIPDNRDERLHVADPNSAFWEWVRDCRSRGWAIAMHGCHHLYATDQTGLVGRMARSEFAGLPFEEQVRKIEYGQAVFTQERVALDAFSAPSNSFDENTIKALTQVGINVLLDGLTFYPFRDAMGVIWIPQQSSRLRRMPFGVWTIALHPNWWTESDLSRFEKWVERSAPRLADLSSVVARFGRRSSKPFELWIADALLKLSRLVATARYGSSATRGSARV